MNGLRCCAITVALIASWAVPAGGAVKPPDDPLFQYQWNLRAIQIPAAWAATRGAGVTVAVLDTGVAYRNRGGYRRAPDLARTRFVAGYDFVDDDPYPDDVPPPRERHSHGTQMAALIAQNAGNGLGAAGVAPDVAIMPIRVLEPDLNGSARAIARGLRFAADHGADVANLSIAGRSPSRVLTDAVDYAVAKGVTVVAASGNGGQEAVGWPAADPQVIAVGAVSEDLTRAEYSNFGDELDVVAGAGAGLRTDTGFGPSDGVIGQALKGDRKSFCFCFTASTSAAAAQVSGVAALLVASGRARAPAKVRAALVASARDLGPKGRDRQYGAGLVQAADALGVASVPQAAVPPQPAAALPKRPAEPVREPDAKRGRWPLLVLGGVLVVAIAGSSIVLRRRRSATSQ